MKKVFWTGGAIAVAIAIGYERLIQAGTSGNVNGLGVGTYIANVVSRSTELKAVNTLVNIQNPGASIPFAPSHTVTGELPEKSSPTTVARKRAEAGYKVFQSVYFSAGDSADNAEIQSRNLQIEPVECGYLDFETSSVIDPVKKSGVIAVDAIATGGTAMLLRGFEIMNNGVPPSSNDDLEARGELRWEVLVIGPFDFRTGACPLLIPFTYKTDLAHLYFATDTLGISKPFEITGFPADINFGCGPVKFPEPGVSGGCGKITYSYSPAADQLPPGKTTLVTVRATDEAENSIQCTFSATRGDLNFNISIPEVVDFGCDNPTGLRYPLQIAGGCQPVNVTYTIGAAALPLGSTIVTATARDALGVTLERTFIAKRGAASFALNCPARVDFDCLTAASNYGVQAVGGCSPVTLSYSLLPSQLPPGVETTVTVTATDAYGAKTQCSFPAMRHSLGFNGFFPPVDGLGGSCAHPVRTFNRGSNIALKFSTTCDNETTVAGAPPTLKIIGCSNGFSANGAFKSVSGEWHYNWDTSQVPQKGDTYSLEVTLQDGVTKKIVFVKIK